MINRSDVPSRLVSLDAMRGFTIALMVTVNFPGSEEYVYATLSHSKWNGLTFTDLVAPFFLFIVGVSIVFAFSKKLEERNPKNELYKKIVIRSLKIFAVGMFLNMMPDFDLMNLRWTGTLHRIAIVFSSLRHFVSEFKLETTGNYWNYNLDSLLSCDEFNSDTGVRKSNVGTRY